MNGTMSVIAALSILMTPASYANLTTENLAITEPKSGELIAQARVFRLGDLLVELETNIKWSAVEQKWSNRRESWIQEVRSASDSAGVAELLAELESNIKWEAVDKRWRSRRDSWAQDCESAKSPRRLAKLLAELETNIKWEAVENKWRSRRDRWIEAVSRE